MAITWNRLFLENKIKDAFGLTRGRNDGLLSDTLIFEAIEMAMLTVADDCHLFPVTEKFPLTANQWQIPIPDDVLGIRDIWYIDTNGKRNPMDYLPQERFMDYHDPTETSQEPYYYCYPIFQRPVIMWYAGAEPIYDYIGISNITEAAYSTVIDSGANFGRTQDGTRIVPGFLVQNKSDDSFGYVEYLDIITPVTDGIARPGTTTTILKDGTKDFVALFAALGIGVEDVPVICNPSAGDVVKYAFVTAVTATELTYASIQGGLSFSSGELYKVGIANKIRLSRSAPHPGLRSGATNKFTVGAEVVSINGTTFTDTSVTGSAPGDAEAGQIAIAATSGSHGKIQSISGNTLTVDKWVGGKPGDGDVISVRACDEYQVEHKFRTQKVLWIRPTPTSSDTVGQESLEAQFSSKPTMPEQDTDPIEIPQKYFDPLLDAALYYSAESKGNHTQTDLMTREARYKASVAPYLARIWQPPASGQLSAYGNRGYASRPGVSWSRIGLGL